MKHILLGVFDEPAGVTRWHIQRRYEDGNMPRIVQWCGRDWGWRFTGHEFSPPPKRYSSKHKARDALTRILHHERELGLTGRRYG